MRVAGMSGNELYCLALKGFEAGEIVVGNSVCSLGLVGGVGAWGRGIVGGEVEGVTQLISEGRHAAINRMEEEAKKQGAVGITSVISELGTLSGYTEFLSQGTAIHGPGSFFSAAASGMELFCHLDAGYQPIRFAMGNVAYALGVGRGLTGLVRTIGRGEVKEFSEMYNHIRHLALERVRKEAHGLGANAVVDIKIGLLPHGAAALELLMTGTASHHAIFGKGDARQVVTSELTGEELWNLAKMGYAPVQLVMATSVYSLGVVGGLGSALRGMARGELPELTSLVYSARENCLDLIRKEAQSYGAERVIGNKLSIRELSPGLIEVMAVGTAVRKIPGIEPASPALIPQAIIVEQDSIESLLKRADPMVAAVAAHNVQGSARRAQGAAGLLVGLIVLFVTICTVLMSVFFAVATGKH